MSGLYFPHEPRKSPAPAHVCPNNTCGRILKIIDGLETRREKHTQKSLWLSLVKISQCGTGDHWDKTAQPLLRQCLQSEIKHDPDIKLASYRVLYHMCLSSSYGCRKLLREGAGAVLVHAILATVDQYNPLLRSIGQNIVLRLVTEVLDQATALDLLTETLEHAIGPMQHADFVRFITWVVDVSEPVHISTEWVWKFMSVIERRFFNQKTVDQRRYLLLIRLMRDKLGDSFWSLAREFVRRMLKDAGGIILNDGDATDFNFNDRNCSNSFDSVRSDVSSCGSSLTRSLETTPSIRSALKRMGSDTD